MIADNALLDALDKLFDKRYDFIDLVNDRYITQVRMREIPTSVPGKSTSSTTAGGKKPPRS